MKKDNEELLVEANELLRKELEEAKAEHVKRTTSPVLLAYAALLAGIVCVSIYKAVVERIFLPLIIAVFCVGWIGYRMRAMADHPTPRASCDGVRIDIGAVKESDAREGVTAEPPSRTRKKARV